jgi:hypothetical protein
MNTPPMKSESNKDAAAGCMKRLVMTSAMYARFVHHGWDAVDDEIRKHFKIPKNRYYSVTVPPSPVGRVIIDHTRTRVIESVKLSKSDISQHNA